MLRSRINFWIWIVFHTCIFFVLSNLLNRSMFSAEIDGFYSQVSQIDQGVGSSNSLSYMHKIRYFIAYPFFFIKENGLPKYMEHVLLLLYVSPVLFLKCPNRIKKISFLLIYFTLFFSYRSVIVMTGIYTLIMLIKYYSLGIKKYSLVIAFVYSLLSSGTVLLWILLVYFHKELFIKNKRIRGYLNILIMIIFFILLGSIFHKLLFFLDANKYGSANDITFEAIQSLDMSDLQEIFRVMIERSLVNEAISNGDYGRVYVIIIEFSLMLLLRLFTKSKFNNTLFVLLLISLLFEGLMTYSMLFSILILFYDFFYTTTKKIRHA